MIELLTTAEMTRADAIAVARGTESFALMQRAGAAVADAATRMAVSGQKILVVAGLGNNGGDGFVAATKLAAAGRDVAVMLLGDIARLKGDAARAARDWRGKVMAFDPAEKIGGYALIIDALFGAGLDRPVTGEFARAIEAINASGVKVLAVDLASGINGTTGEVMGVAVRATRSVTFFRKKPGHLLLPGRVHCGPVEVADIGIPREALDEIRPQTFENLTALWAKAFPVPRIDGHKYSRGHALVGSGGIAATGAARLAARAALRAGAGLVTVASPRAALVVNAAALTAVMVRAIDTAQEYYDELLADPRFNACVVGPGFGVGERAREIVAAILSARRACVLDADALTSFSDDPQLLIAGVKNTTESVIFTPHEGEFARLFGPLVGGGGSKLDRARKAAALSGATIVLKGPDTVVAHPDGRAAIAANAPPWLATAGSGDVLAGIIGGLLAQGVDGFHAAAIAVWLHGAAGTQVGPGLIAEDLPEALPAVLRKLLGELHSTANH
jgi:ADP-dependent NAD(P)H-hydrate dehydratase / NAD(P)H-hydrate epimerase